MAIPTGDSSKQGKPNGVPARGLPPQNGQRRQGGLPPLGGQGQKSAGAGIPRQTSGAPQSRPRATPPQRQQGLPSPQPQQGTNRSQQTPPQRRQPAPRAPRAPLPQDLEDELFSGITAPADDGYDPNSLGYEDDPFEPIPEDELSYDDGEDGYYEERPQGGAAPQAGVAPLPQSRQPQARRNRTSGAPVEPRQAKVEEEDYQEEFIDEENIELKPYGGKKKKASKKAKVSDFDNRKNLEGQRKLYRTIFVLAIVAIVGFGAFKTFMPVQVLTEDEVATIAAWTNGDTGFPTTRGEGFALSFVDTLVNYSEDQQSKAKRDVALQYFTGGSDSAFAANESFSVMGNIKQSIIYGPVVLESDALTENAGAYKIGMLLSTAPLKDPEGDGVRYDELASEQLRWVAFNVNVYYDVSNDSFRIAEGSPTLLPYEEVIAEDLPVAQSLGEPVETPPGDASSIALGFIKEYRQSSKSDTSALESYIIGDDPTLRTGLNSKYQFSTMEDEDASVEMTFYKNEAEADAETPSQLKVEMIVQWAIPMDEEGKESVKFTSTYVLTLDYSGSGYKVSKFAPYYWSEQVPEDGTEDGAE